MNLLVDASFHTGIRVGIARYIECLVRELSFLCNVTLLTSVPGVFSNLKCNTISIPAWTQSHRGRLLWQLTKLRNYCTTDYDLLFCPTPVAPPFCSIPVISVVHDLTPLIAHQLHGSKYKASFLVGLKSLVWADYIVTDSHYTKQEIIKRGLFPAQKIKVIHLGPGIVESYGNCNLGLEFQPYILYVGGHIPNKNVPRLITAFAQINNPAHIKMVLVGWGSPEQIGSTLATIERTGIRDRVILMPEISDQELSSLYHHCSLFVFPSLCEGFGLPVLEAMYHGAPIACSYSSSLPEIAANGALYFDPTRTRSIRNTIELLLNNQTLCHQVSSAARKRAQLFCWRNAARELSQLAEKVVRTRCRVRS